MKKLLPLLLLLCACSSSRSGAIALNPETTLIASNGEIFSIKQMLDALTPDDRDRLERHYPRTLDRIEALKQLNMQDIQNMTRSGLSDTAIIHYIHATRSIFYLTPDNEATLRQAGVSQRVIDEMKETVDTSY